MNNSQFRKLVLETPSRQVTQSFKSDGSSQTKNAASASVPVLGSRARSSIPMTPRSVAGSSYSADFARQLAERNSSSSHPRKKFRSSAAPKGATLPAGYLDRSKSRLSGAAGDAENDKAERVKALEEMMKLDQIDNPTFIRLREEILGDKLDTERASIVKGLDWGLLKRVRKGEVGVEDILEGFGEKNSEKPEDSHEEEFDEEFEKLEEKEVQAVVHQVTKKKGQMAPPALTGKKTRDQILAELKSSRKAASQPALPRLGSRFKRVGESKPQSRIERDSRGREVLITLDEDGNEKRKVRKVSLCQPAPEKSQSLLIPDKDAKPLGMEVPEAPHVAKEEEIIDIFDDVGDDYNPLAGLDVDEDSEHDEAEVLVGESCPDIQNQVIAKLDSETSDQVTVPISPPHSQPAVRNYFQTPLSTELSTNENSTNAIKPPALLDSTMIAALKRASEISLKISSNRLKSANPSEDSAEAAINANEERYRRMLQRDDRDAQDMDLGFGSSRLEDDIDEDEAGFKLSEWTGIKEGVRGEVRAERKGKRKRGPKRRKGD